MTSTSIGKNKKAGSGRGLGRGLGSLLGAPESSERAKTVAPAKVVEAPVINTNIENKTPQKTLKTISIEERILQIDIEKITTNKEQPRKLFDKKSLESLAASIKEQGIIQPISVKQIAGGQFEIIAGERRWRASQQAGLHKVPVIIKKISEQKSLEFALIENIQREDLNVVEEAMAYKHLMDKFDLTQNELAQKVGKERATIANVLRILNLAPEVREMVIASEITMGHAKLLLTVKDFRMQFKIARKIIKSKLSVKQTDKLIKKLQNTVIVDVNTNKALVSTHILNLKNEIQKILGTKVNLNYGEGKSKLQIQFYSDDELSQFVENLRSSWNQ